MNYNQVLDNLNKTHYVFGQDPKRRYFKVEKMNGKDLYRVSVYKYNFHFFTLLNISPVLNLKNALLFLKQNCMKRNSIYGKILIFRNKIIDFF